MTGKTPGTDLREKVPTLPTLLLRASDDPADAELKEMLDADLSDDAVLSDVLDKLRANHVIDEARVEIQRRADRARTHLTPLPDGDAKQALEALCDEVVSRSS